MAWKGGSQRRNQGLLPRTWEAAEAFFRSAWMVSGVTPDRITTDGHDAYPRAIRTAFGA